MLPVRLGMLNANGPQDLVLYVLTPQGRVETTNYRTVKLPANMDLPTFVRGEFAPTYKALFDAAGGARGLPRDLHRVLLGHGLVRSVRRRSADARRAAAGRRVLARPARRRARRRPAGDADAAAPALHARFAARGPRVPGDRRPAELPGALRAAPPVARRRGKPAARPRRISRKSRARQEREAPTLASLTGWDVNAIRARMALAPQPKSRWWEALWK